METQSRWKSWVVWTSVAAVVFILGFLLKGYGLYTQLV